MEKANKQDGYGTLWPAQHCTTGTNAQGGVVRTYV